jgi:two-component system LytT family sensor kinase
MVLNGDRLYQVELPWDKLLYTISGLSLAVWFANIGIERYILPKIKIIHPLLVQFALSVVAITLISFISVEVTSLTLGGPFSLSERNFMLTAGFCFRINLFLNSINAIYFFNKRYREKEIETARLKTLNITARYEVLNNQINPHFLFNNLNVLSTLMHKDINAADDYLQKLSEIYRYLLQTKDKELVTLGEELNFLNDYLSLLSIRFKEALLVDLSITDESKQYYLPPVVLQLLLENVVKHNYFTKEEPVTVNIHSEEDRLIISNNIRAKKQKSFSSAIGLNNISERYQFLDKSISVENHKDLFKVTLPLIKL